MIAWVCMGRRVSVVLAMDPVVMAIGEGGTLLEYVTAMKRARSAARLVS